MQNLTYMQGNMFDSKAVALGHGVNTSGVMGAGVAKVVRELFPDVYDTYRAVCKKGILKPGHVLPIKTDDGRYIMNLASQDKPGPNASYEWVDSSLSNTLAFMTEYRIPSLAIPRIGCGIGGLDWELVEDIIVISARNFPAVNIEVWTL